VIDIGNDELETYGQLFDAIGVSTLAGRGFREKIDLHDSGIITDINGNTVGRWDVGTDQ
jgi:hypothetical protein